MRWSRIVLYSAGTLVAIIAIALLLVFSVDLGRFKPNIEALVSETLNREFAIDGPLHINLGSSVELSAEQVRLAGTEWSSEPQLASVSNMELSINTWSLLNGPVKIESLHIDGIKIYLQEDGEGNNNWTFATAEEKSDAPSEEPTSEKRFRLPVMADNVLISDTQFQYDRPDRTQPLSVAIDTLTENVLESDQVQVSLSGTVNGTPVAMEMLAGEVEELVELTDVEIELQGNLGEIEFDGSADIADLLAPQKPTVALNLNGPNIEYLTDILQLQRVTTGPLRMESSIVPNGERMQLALNGDFGEFTVLANGQFDNLTDLQHADLQVSLSGPNAATVAKLLGRPEVPSDPFGVIGTLRRSANDIAVEEIKITIGDTQLTLNGQFNDFPDPNGANATVRLSGPDLSRFAKLLGLPGRVGGPFRLDADLAPIAGGGGASVDVAATAEGFTLNVDGDVVDDPQFVGSRVNVNIAGPNLRTITDAFDIPAAPAEAFALDVILNRVADGIVMEDGAMSVGDDRFTFGGTVGNRPLEADTDLSFELAGPDLADLLQDFGLDADELPYAPYRLSGRVERVPEHFVLRDVVAAVGDDLEYEFSADGTITDHSQLLGSRIRLGTRGVSLGAITDAAGIDGLPDVPFDAAATVEFVDKGYAVDQGRVRVGDENAKVDGLVGFDPLAGDTDVDFEVSSPDLKSALEGVGIEIEQLPPGELNASGAIRARSGTANLQDILITFAGAEARISGDLGEPPNFAGTELKLEISGTDLSKLLPDDQKTAGLKKPFELATRIRLTDERLLIDSAAVAIDQTRLRADVAIGLDPVMDFGEFRIQAESPDVLVLSQQLADVAITDTVPLNFVAAANWADNFWNVEQFDLNLGEGRLLIGGSIDGPPSFDRTDLTFDWQIASLERFSILAKRDLPDQPAHLKFHLTGSGDLMTMDEFDGLIGDSDISGEFSLTAGDIPTIALSLTSQRLNIAPFQRDEPEEVAPTEPSPPKDPNRKVIPDTPIPLDALTEFLANVNIRIGELQGRERTLEDLVLVGSVVDGILTVNEFGVKNTEGGELNGRLGLRPTESGAEFGMRLFGKEIQLGLPAYSAEDLRQLPKYEMDLAFITEGSTVREMAASVNGYLRLVSGEGKMRAGAMKMFTSDFLFELFNTLNPFQAEDAYTNLKCTAVLAAIEDGQLAGNPIMVIQSDRLNIFANAQVDLKTERLNADFNTVPQKGLGISLSNLVNPYVKVGGTLGNPQLSLDPESTLIQGGAAVATGGLSVLALGLKDRFLSSRDPCGKAVADADKEFQALREKYGRSGDVDRSQ